MSLLHAAAARGDVNAVSRYLAQSYNINRRSYFTGDTPFLSASKDNRASVEMLQLLYQRGADPFKTSSDLSKTALHHAVSAGNIPKIDYLIKLGLDVNQRDKYGYTPMLQGALNPIPNKRRVLKLLLSNDATYHRLTQHGESVVRACASDFELLQLFDRKEVVSQLSWTPLMSSAVFDSLVEMKRTIDAGATVEPHDIMGRTVWHLAIETGDIAKTKFLYQQDIQMGEDTGRYPNSYYAIRHNHVDMLSWVASMGADLTAHTVTDTPFTVATVNNADNCLRWLLNQNIATQHMLDEALLYLRSPKLAELLLNAGANVNFVDGTGETPLGNAIEINALNVVQYLLQQGADPNLQCFGSTPLIRAVANDNLELAELLIQYGADVNYQTSPDMWFALQDVRSEKMLEFLLAHNADPMLSDAGGATAQREIAKWDENLATLLENLTK